MNLDEQFCYLTTTGRKTGRPHTIEIWFGGDGDTLYMLSGGGDRSDWVKNLVRGPKVRVRVGGQERDASARVVEDPDEDGKARRLLASKYQGWRDGQPLSSWARTALPVAIEVASDMPAHDAHGGGALYPTSVSK
jgi:deazaflavin-dependent oxidoreductase (nitroreductase family)